MTSKSKKTSKEGSDAFSKHSVQQQQKEQPPQQQQRNESSDGDFGKMSLKARLLVFIIVPLSTGFIGLAASYLQSTRTTDVTLNKDNKPHEIDFDNDFVTPALLGLAFVIVIGFQTGGFQIGYSGGGGRGRGGGGGGMERKFALSWPKARRIKKVRRERVIIEDDDVGDDLGDNADDNNNVGGEKEDKKDR